MCYVLFRLFPQFIHKCNSERILCNRSIFDKVIIKMKGGSFFYLEQGLDIDVYCHWGPTSTARFCMTKTIRYNATSTQCSVEQTRQQFWPNSCHKYISKLYLTTNFAALGKMPNLPIGNQQLRVMHHPKSLKLNISTIVQDRENWFSLNHTYNKKINKPHISCPMVTWPMIDDLSALSSRASCSLRSLREGKAQSQMTSAVYH